MKGSNGIISLIEQNRTEQNSTEKLQNCTENKKNIEKVKTIVNIVFFYSLSKIIGFTISLLSLLHQINTLKIKMKIYQKVSFAKTLSESMEEKLLRI